MPCPADASVIARDPDLPGLAVLLDDDRFAEALARAYPDAGIRGVQPHYVRYKPATSCLVGWTVTTGRGPIEVYARTHAPDTEAKLEKATQRDAVATALGGGIRVLADEAMVVYPFPNDHELPALASLIDPASRPAMLAELLPEHPELCRGSLTPLRYKPERRYVARLEGERGAAVVRLYNRHDYLEHKDNADAFSPCPPLRLPARLGRQKRIHAVAIEWIEGRPLRAELADRTVEPAASRVVGMAVARLHAQKPRKLREHWSPDRYATQLDEAAAVVAQLVPTLGGPARQLASWLGHKATSRHWRGRHAVHGDLSADQIILHGGEVGIIDFDRAAYGDPRLDLGSFRARLDVEVLQGDLTADRADACFEGLLEGYESASGRPVSRKLQRFTAGALLHLAAEPFRHRHADWPSRIEAIVARAAERAGAGATA